MHADLVKTALRCICTSDEEVSADAAVHLACASSPALYMLNLRVMLSFCPLGSASFLRQKTSTSSPTFSHPHSLTHVLSPTRPHDHTPTRQPIMHRTPPSSASSSSPATPASNKPPTLPPPTPTPTPGPRLQPTHQRHTRSPDALPETDQRRTTPSTININRNISIQEQSQTPPKGPVPRTYRPVRLSIGRRRRVFIYRDGCRVGVGGGRHDGDDGDGGCRRRRVGVDRGGRCGRGYGWRGRVREEYEGTRRVPCK